MAKKNENTSITYGNIIGSTGVAIGTGASVTVNGTTVTSDDDQGES